MSVRSRGVEPLEPRGSTRASPSMALDIRQKAGVAEQVLLPGGQMAGLRRIAPYSPHILRRIKSDRAHNRI